LTFYKKSLTPEIRQEVKRLRLKAARLDQARECKGTCNSSRTCNYPSQKWELFRKRSTLLLIKKLENTILTLKSGL
jgi:hypothetical protein